MINQNIIHYNTVSKIYDLLNINSTDKQIFITIIFGFICTTLYNKLANYKIKFIYNISNTLDDTIKFTIRFITLFIIKTFDNDNFKQHLDEIIFDIKKDDTMETYNYIDVLKKLKDDQYNANKKGKRKKRIQRFVFT